MIIYSSTKVSVDEIAVSYHCSLFRSRGRGQIIYSRSGRVITITPLPERVGSSRRRRCALGIGAIGLSPIIVVTRGATDTPTRFSSPPASTPRANREGRKNYAENIAGQYGALEMCRAFENTQRHGQHACSRARTWKERRRRKCSDESISCSQCCRRPARSIGSRITTRTRKREQTPRLRRRRASTWLEIIVT